MDRPESLRNEIIIVLLALISVILMIIEVTMELAPGDRVFLDRVDLSIAFIFLAEWIWRFARAESRSRFVKRSWWELLASIPLTNDVAQGLRSLRLLRLFRILRVLRIIRFATRMHILMRHSQILAGETHLISLGTSAGIIVLSATLGFHAFEFGHNPNVTNLFDSFWWAMCTVTTVGYGDISPTTSAGRFIGIFLMVFGAGVVAAFTAFVASFLVRNRREPAGAAPPAESLSEGGQDG